MLRTRIASSDAGYAAKPEKGAVTCYGDYGLNVPLDVFSEMFDEAFKKIQEGIKEIKNKYGTEYQFHINCEYITADVTELRKNQK